MKPRYIAASIFILVGLTSLINSIIGNVIASLIEKQLGIDNAKLLIYPFLIIAAFLIGYELRGQFSTILLQRETIENKSILLRNRERMIDRVDAIWIKDVLEKSLHNITRIELNIELGTEHVDYPWEGIVQRPHLPDQIVTSSKRLLDVFSDLGNEMLILGSPGGGKTTLLLELTKDLLDKARNDREMPIPVVFSLSSWSHRSRSLREWLIEELVQKYDVPSKIAKSWINNNYIQPMLDGLDEVQSEFREACVESINQYRRDAGFIPIVVCTRIADYELLKVKLRLNGSVLIKPVTQSHIHTFFRKKSLAGIKALIDANPQMVQLLDTPLMLNIMALTFKDKTRVLLAPSSNIDSMRYELFNAYIDSMFERRGKRNKEDRSETISYLAWLANSMLKQSQSVFLIERIQPEWLTTTSIKRFYFLIDRVVMPILLGLVISAVAIPIATLVEQRNLMIRVHSSMSTMFNIIEFGFGLPYAYFTIGISVALAMFWGGINVSHLNSSRIKNLAIGGIIGWGLGLLITTMALKEYLLTNLVEPTTLIAMLLGVMVATIAGGPNIGLRNVNIVERVRWSFIKSLPFIFYSLIGVPLVWFGMMYIGFGFTENLSLLAPLVVLQDGVFTGIVIAILTGIFGGLVTDEIESKTIPNQGINRSFVTSLTIGFLILICGGVIGLLVGGLFQLSNTYLTNELAPSLITTTGDAPIPTVLAGFIAGLSEVVPIAVAAMLSYGGFAVMSHYSLRIVFWIHRFAPLNYIEFLDYCVDKIFLRKVGGGYSFIHRILLETFAKKI